MPEGNARRRHDLVPFAAAVRTPRAVALRARRSAELCRSRRTCALSSGEGGVRNPRGRVIGLAIFKISLERPGLGFAKLFTHDARLAPLARRPSGLPRELHGPPRGPKAESRVEL